MNQRVLRVVGWTLRGTLDPNDPMLIEWAEQVGSVDRQQLQQAEEQAEEQLRRDMLERWEREEAERRQRAAEYVERHRRYMEEQAAREEQRRLARENETDEQRAKRLARAEYQREYQRELRVWRKRMDAKDREQKEREADERAERKARERIAEAQQIAEMKALLTWYAEQVAGEYDFGQEHSFARRRLRETGYHVHSMADPAETEDIAALDDVLRANRFRIRKRAA